MTRQNRTRELEEITRQNQSFALVNVLSDGDFANDKLGSLNAELAALKFLKHVVELTRGDKHMRVVIYCSGPRFEASTRAANLLVDAGYTNVEEYRAGTEVWHTSPRDGGAHRGNRIASGVQRPNLHARCDPRERTRNPLAPGRFDASFIEREDAK